MAIETYILNNDEWVLGSLVNGQPYRIINTTNGAIREGTSFYKEDFSKFKTSNELVTINGNAPIGKQPVYFASTSDNISIQFDIVDDNNDKQTQIDSVSLNYPPVLVVPVMKYANNNVIDETYFDVTIVNGLITASGTLPSTGNWKMVTNRVNESLKAIGADWQFDDSSANFIVR